jgi:uncharacterized protein YkwD
MKVRFVGLVALCCAFGIIVSFSRSDRGQTQTVKDAVNDGLSQDERELLNEINQARAHPQQYASYLEGLKPLFHGKQYQPSNQDSFTTQEGWSAVEDAIKFLRAAKPLGPLSPSHGLCLAALSHVKDQSGTGATGHKGADSSLIEQRVKPFGSWQGGIGENLTYGNESARERLLTWLIDDGFPARGHRVRLMSSDYKVAGVCCGPHPEFRSMCVITLAGGFVDAQPAKTEANSRPKAATPATKAVTPTTKSKTVKKTARTHRSPGNIS